MFGVWTIYVDEFEIYIYDNYIFCNIYNCKDISNNKNM